jgi:hypothetical protein
MMTFLVLFDQEPAVIPRIPPKVMKHENCFHEAPVGAIA